MISFFDSIFKNNGFLSQQIQTDDELLEGGSKRTTLILSANTNTRRDDDRTPYYHFQLLDQNQPCYREASATNTSKTGSCNSSRVSMV